MLVNRLPGDSELLGSKANDVGRVLLDVPEHKRADKFTALADALSHL
jgi:hypothetical protein